MFPKTGDLCRWKTVPLSSLPLRLSSAMMMPYPEATRLTDARTMLSSDEMEELSQCLNQALENITERDSYTFIYFIPDNKKSGGKYETVTGIIKSFNEYERTIKLENGDILRIDDIVSISGEVFDKD